MHHHMVFRFLGVLFIRNRCDVQSSQITWARFVQSIIKHEHLATVMMNIWQSYCLIKQDANVVDTAGLQAL